MPFILRDLLEQYDVPAYVICDIEDDYTWYKRHLHLAEKEIEYLYGVLDSIETALAEANH